MCGAELPSSPQSSSHSPRKRSMTPTPMPGDKQICQRCGHIWISQTVGPTRRCPNCDARNWRTPLRSEDASPPNAPRAGTVRLPNTCPNNRQTFVRILTAVSSEAWNGAGFTGSLHKPGAQVAAEVVHAHPVLLECAGRNLKDKSKDWLWVLWNWNAEAKQFFEIARALATDWCWATVLRGPAIRALEPRREAVDPRDRAGTALEEILAAMDAALSRELPGVRTLVLTALYDRIAARLMRDGQ